MGWITVILIGAVLLLGLAIWSIKRHKDPHLALKTDDSLDGLIASISGMSLGMAIRGNSAEIFENGAYFDGLLEDILAAKQTVHFETYLWKEGRIGQRMADAFSKQARAGVKVRLVLDAVGCKKMGAQARRQMEDAGCKIAIYHPRTLKNIGVVVERDHRKLAILDGRTAWVGGHCIVDAWLGNAEDRDHVRDLSVRLRGPVVHAVQSVFSENWVEVTGRLFVGADAFPTLEPAGEVEAHIASMKPEGSAPAVKILHHTVICCARKRLWIQNPYFIPEIDAVEALAEAVKRGVDVRVLMPSTSGSDNPMVQHAGHRNFEKLMRNGVRLFEYPHTLLHQKVMTVDGIYSAVGSANFDDRSFETNDEVTLGILDGRIAQRLDAIFERYVARAAEIDLEKWNRRGLWHKLKDQAAYSINELL